MGRAGPQPVPTVLKQMRGRKIRGAHNEPSPRVCQPYCPEFIRNDSVAFQEWQRLSEILQHMRVLTEADYVMLSAICVTYSTMAKAQTEILKMQQAPAHDSENGEDVGELSADLQGLVHWIGKKKVTRQKKDGTVEVTEAPGYAQVSVLEALVRDSVDKLGRLCAAFGLSPASRPGIHAAPDAPTNDPWSEL